MQATRPATIAPQDAGRGASEAPAAERLNGLLRVLGGASLLALLAALVVLALDAAQAPSRYVPADIGGWPGWLAGPLAGAGSHLGSDLRA